MIELSGYVARGNMPDVARLADARELLKWLDETWLEAKRDAEAWGLEGHEAQVIKLRITIQAEEEEERKPAAARSLGSPRYRLPISPSMS
jgi:hypothetical protein